MYAGRWVLRMCIYICVYLYVIIIIIILFTDELNSFIIGYTNIRNVSVSRKLIASSTAD